MKLYALQGINSDKGTIDLVGYVYAPNSGVAVRLASEQMKTSFVTVKLVTDERVIEL